jgi:DNA-binding transcriptional regulator YiaG
MKQRTIKEMIDAKEQIERGEKAPASVWEVRPGSKGCIRRRLSSKLFQKAQRQSWKSGVVSTREKLGLSQEKFARLLGISVRTLHHWEQGTRKPNGAAQVLLRIAATNPEVVLAAA